MTTLRFGDYEFPYNPAVIRVENEAVTASALCPGFGTAVQDMGPGRRVVSGAGSFFGADAQEQYRALEKAYEARGAQLLQVPGLPAVMAVFSRLANAGRGDGSVIEYTFSFTAAPLAEAGA